MQCNKSNFYIPILDAIVADSLVFNAFFDTGIPSDFIIVSDSLKGTFVGNKISVQIGKQKKQMGIDFVESKRLYFNKQTIIIGWEFFKDKVIELSFDKQYIRVYESLPDITNYSKIKITANTHLAIPVKVVLQGKTLEDTAFIDTGNNGYASFATDLAAKYRINVEDANYGKAMTNVGYFSGYSLPVDTIKIGNLFIANQNMRVGFRPRTKDRDIGGLIGTRTFANFSVILDLINYDLYLRPL
jgi:hypothetical protein